MKLLRLRSMEIINFRLIKHLQIIFSTDVTLIEGHNKKGKSTIRAAHKWLFTGRDLENKKNSNILSKFDGVIERGIEASVQEVYDIEENGKTREVTLRRVFKEVWDNNDEGVPFYNGTTSEYYINEEQQPRMKDWDAALKKIIDPEVFNYMSDPEYVFRMEQTNLRKFLLGVVGGEISPEEILKEKPEFAQVVEKLKSTTFDALKKSVNGQLEKLEEQRAAIEPEITREIQARPAVQNWKQIESEIAELQVSLNSVGEKITLASQGEKFDTYKEKLGELKGLKLNLQEIKNNFSSIALEEQRKINVRKDPLSKSITDDQQNIRTLKYQIESDTKELDNLTKKVDALADKFDLRNAEVFETKPDDLNCASCGAVLEGGPDAVIEKEKAFNAKKEKELKEIEAEGLKLDDLIADCEKRIDDNKTKMAELESSVAANKKALEEIKDYDKKVEDTDLYKDTLAQIEAMELELIDPPKSDDEELIVERDALIAQIADKNKLLGHRDLIEKSEKQVESDRAREREILLSIAKFKKSKATLKAYSMLRSELLENKVNALFDGVQFQLFREKNDGDLEEICLPIAGDGYEFLDTNTAGKTAMFIALTEGLSRIYDVKVPVFLDNRESVIDIPETDLQIINLRVKENQFTLKITNK